MSDLSPADRPTYNRQQLLAALRLLGDKLEAIGQHAELSLVGGAAGMLTYQLDYDLLTRDCDVMLCVPKDLLSKIECIAWEVADELKMDPHWLNSDTQLTSDNLPEGWEARRIWIGDYGALKLMAASRLDLIAMKVVAGRPQDLRHLRQIKPERHELAFARQHLTIVRERNPNRGAALDAAILLITVLENSCES